jgi:DNA-binding NtrC family response regulator
VSGSDPDPDRVSGSQSTSVEHISTTSRKRRAQGAGGRYWLVVVGEGKDATYPLPDAGEVVIGRGENADVRIDHRSVSRRHALLALGEKLTLEDLGSANGTRVRDAWLRAHTPAVVSLGEPFDVGSVMVVVQQRPAPSPQRHIWAHGYFEARLEEECARAERSASRFAVVRLHVGRGDASRTVEACLARELRTMDVIGYYGPAEYELLVLDAGPAVVDAITEHILTALAGDDIQARIGVAHYPDDARDPYSLLERASSMALGQPLPKPGSGTILVADAAMQHLDRVVQRIAGGTISVLITGETGVGKEVLAERLHKLSPRAQQPFLRLNCAALSESLLESELFGHERGAFTGAVRDKQGLLETAQGGTIFLDEIGELPMSIQVKLLRVLEERQVLRVGALKPRPIDVRFLAATNRDLEAEIARGAFRQDLYFRLNGISLVIPPLRQRTGEIAALAEAFLAQACVRAGREPVPRIAPDALACLRQHSWPGNIRELRNVVERALLLCTDETIRLEHLPTEKMTSIHAPRVVQPRPATAPPVAMTAPPPAPPTPPAPPAPAPAPPAAPRTADETDHDGLPPASVAAPAAPKRSRRDTEDRKRIVDALARSAGNQTEAAKLLGISRRTLINRVIAHGIRRPRKP